MRKTLPILCACLLGGAALAKDVKHADPNKPCVTSECHADTTKFRFLHGPLAVAQCFVCHTPVAGSDHKFKLVAAGEKLCNLCHQPIAKVGKLHDPVAKGDCSGCHTSHGSAVRTMLKKTDLAELCLDCHKPIRQWAAAKDFKHKDLLTSRNCGNCHNPHVAQEKKLLRARIDTLCFGCHDKLQKEIARSEFKHGPVEKGQCDACHVTHDSSRAALLNRNLTPGFYASFSVGAYALCFSCHDHKKELVTEEKTLVATKFRNGDRNLHFVHVNRDYKGRTCRTCHAAHGAGNRQLVSGEVPFGDWKIPIRFAATATGGSCESGCHKPLAYDRQTPVEYPKEDPAGGSAAPVRRL